MLIPVSRSRQHKINSTILQKARNLKEKLPKGTRQINDIITEGKGKGRLENSHVTYDEKLMDNEHSYQWLKFGDVKEGTESTVVAAQDQAVSTDSFKKQNFGGRN